MRAAIRDARLGPFVNLVSNPAMEATSGTVEVARNLVPNPAMMPTDGTIGVLRNRFPNPRCVEGGAWLLQAANNNPTDNAQFLTGITDLPAGLTTAARVAPTNTGSWCRVGHQGDLIKLTPGRTYTVSAYGRINTAGIRVGVNVVWRDSAGVSLGEAPTPWVSADNITVDAWQRYSGTFTAPAGTDHAYVYLRGENQAGPGKTLDATGFMVDEWPFLRDYIDGSTVSNDPDLETRWLDGENSSASELYGQAVAGISTNQCLAIRSEKFGGSLRLIPTGSNNSYAELSGNIVPLGNVTALATMHLEAPITGPLHEQALRLNMLNPFKWSDTSPNQAGSYEHRLTDATHNTRRLILRHGGAVGSGDVYWSNVMLTEGEYNGPYFDGSMSPDPDLTASWEGTANASASVLTGLQVADVTPPIDARMVAYSTQDAPLRGERALRYSLAEGESFTLQVSNVTASVDQPVTVSVRVRARDTTSAIMVGYSAPDLSELVTLPAGEWVELRKYTPNPALTSPILGGIMVANEDGTVLPPNVIDIDTVMVVEGEYDGPYFDGDSPRCVWLGVPHQSQSVGYPTLS